MKVIFAVSLCAIFSASFTQASDQLEMLVVSATRLEQPMGLAPSNISVIGGEQLSITQSEHIQQQLRQVPGVSLQRGDGQESLPGIRSAVLTGAGACGSVLIMEEGVSVRGPAFCNVNELFDTHFEQAGQIEVTRGPGTSFYGSNSLTGSVNVSLPLLTSAYVALELGNEHYRRVKGAVSYDGNSAQGTAYVTVTDTDSFRDDAGYSQRKASWRHRHSFGGWTMNAGLTATKLDQETAGFITGFNSYKDRGVASQNPNPEAFRNTTSLRTWARFVKDTASGNQLQLTPYARATEMDFRLHFLPGAPLEQNRQSGLGMQSSLRGQLRENINWVLGVDVDFSDGELRQTQVQATQGSAFLRATIPTGTHYDYQVGAQQLGVFTHVDWQVNSELSVLAGLRMERLDYDYDNRALNGRTRDDGSVCVFGGCRYSRPADREDSFSELSPKFELRYQINDVMRLHASAASSFRAPQAAELYRLQRAQQVADLDSVQADNIELGIAYRNAALQLSATVYQLEQENVIIRNSDFFNVDGGRVDGYGLEVSLKYAISDRWSWRFAGAWSKHKYASKQFSGDINIKGNDVDTAPNSQLNLGLNWQADEVFSAELELQHIGAYFLEPENLRTYPGHHVLSLRAGYQLGLRLKATARIINVTNKRYAERADFTSFTDERYFPGAPRTVFIGLRYDFDK